MVAEIMTVGLHVSLQLGHRAPEVGLVNDTCRMVVINYGFITTAAPVLLILQTGAFWKKKNGERQALFLAKSRAKERHFFLAKIQALDGQNSSFCLKERVIVTRDLFTKKVSKPI